MPPPPRRLYRVYVDETGDRGIGATSSPYFVLSAVMVRDEKEADLRSVRDQICTDLDKPTTTVLHWAQNMKDHTQRKHVSSLLGQQQAMRLAFVIVDKRGLRTSGATGASDHAKMYNYAVRRLLERISWCIDSKHGEAIITFAHVRRFPYARFTAYLQYLQSARTSITWEAIRGLPRIGNQNALELLQVADITAGCVGVAITPDRFGNLESAYLAALAPLIYDRPPTPVTSYGMNVVGDPTALTSLPWWTGVFPPI